MKMKKMFFALLLCCPLIGFSQKNTIQQNFATLYGRNEEQIVSLAEAIPADKYNWRPAEGVRSVREVILHIASSNYFLMSGIGFPPPAGVDAKAIEALTDKTQIIDALKKSLAYTKEKGAQLKDANLEDKVKLPFGEFTKQVMLLILLEHSGEHKGQLIAYSRSNGVVPPWSKDEK
jgi:uncharacterized damage-inducible protein DinB